MRTRSRLACLFLLALATVPGSGDALRAGQPVPSSPEPPLADARGGLVEGMPFLQDPPTPAVAIKVRVPAQVDAGKEIEYRILVENGTKAAAHHVIVRNPLPANARFVRAQPEPTAAEPELVWQLGTLEACTRKEITLVLAPTGGGEVKNCARVQFEHGQCTTTRVAGPTLRFGKRGPNRAALNDILTFQIAVANPNSTPVENVVVTDTLPDGLEHATKKTELSWDVGTLNPGQVRNFEYQVLAAKEGRLCNKAVVVAAGGIREEAISCVTVGAAILELTQRGPERQFVNLAATYQITVRNAGSLPLANVVLAAPVPEKTTFLGASLGGRLTGKQIRWELGTLPARSSRTVEFGLRAQEVGKIRQQATVTADQGASRQAEVTTEFFGEPGLNLDINDTDPVEAGKEGRYLVRVRNTGAAAATNVQITATVPEQMTVRIAAGPASRVDGQVVRFDPVTVQPGKEMVYEINVKAEKAGEVRFRVEMKADQLTSGPVKAEESTTIFSDK